MSSQEVGDIFGKGGGPAQAMLRSPTVLIVAVGLWGMNIFFFRLFGINYKYVLNYDLLKEEQEKGHHHHHHHHHHHPPLPPVVIGQPPPETGGGAGVAGAVAGKAVLPITITTTAPSSTGSLSLSGVTLLDTNSIRDVNNNNAAIMEDLLHNSKDNKMRLDFQDENKLLSTEAAATAAAAAGGSGGAEITWYKLVIFSMILLILLHSTTHFWMDALGRGVVGAVFLFYFSVLLYIFVPLSSNQWLRKAFRITLQRIYALIHPRCWCFRTLLPSSQMGGGGVVVVPRPIPFVDVFFADAMCSLSKVFFDWGMLLHMASHYPNPVPQEAHNIIVPSIFATIPFCIRARQCLLMWSIGRMQKDPNRHQHMANAIKYASSIWPLLLSAYQKTMSDSVAAQQLDIYLYILMTINALYALYWDIVMDWGMMQNPQAIVAQACAVTTSSLGSVGGGTSSSSNAAYDPLAKPTTSPKDDHHPHHHHHRSGSGRPSSSIPAMMDEWSKQAPSASKLKGGAGGSSFPKCHHLLLRPRLRFGLTMSALIVLSDAVLRFSWLLRFVSSHLFHSHDAFVLCTQFLEVFRRAIWNLLRVEWENIKQKSKQLKARDSLSDTEEDMNNNDHDYDYDHHDLSFTEQEQQEMIQLLQTPSSNNNNNNNTSSSHGVELHHPLHAGSGGGGVPSSSSLAV